MSNTIRLMLRRASDHPEIEQPPPTLDDLQLDVRRARSESEAAGGELAQSQTRYDRAMIGLREAERQLASAVAEIGLQHWELRERAEPSLYEDAVEINSGRAIITKMMRGEG